MEPTEYGDCVDAAVCLERPSNRLLVPEGLVRTRFVVEAYVLRDDAPEVILTEDENVVEHLSAERCRLPKLDPASPIAAGRRSGRRSASRIQTDRAVRS